VGETGAAALAGLVALRDDHGDEFPVPSNATVLLVATEGVTDPVNFERIVGRPPR
jgi:diaminopropionate ammonia-lyase